MEVILYQNFSKKHNSTKQPTDEGYSTECYIKQSTSIVNPTLVIESYTHEYMLSVNYLYIPSLHRFYFVNDVILNKNNFFELQCQTDYLATFKNEIGNYTAYIERASTGYNVDIFDAAVSTEQDYISESTTYKQITDWSTAGCYVIRTVGTASGSAGAVNTYAMSSSAFQVLLDYLFTEGNFEDIFSESTYIKALFNPFNYILDVKWFPFSASHVAGNSTSVPIKFGWWQTNSIEYVAYKLDHLGVVEQNTITLPAKYYNDFRDYNAAFTNYKLWLPGAGVIQLNPQDVKNGLRADYIIDFATGIADIVVNNNAATVANVNIITTVQARIGVPIQISQLSLNTQGALSGALGAIGSFMSGNVIAGSASTIAAVNSMTQPTQQILGQQGNLTSLREFDSIALTRTVVGSGQIPTTVYGRPVCKNLQINTLSGFIKCGSSSLDVAGFAGDKDAVNSYLNSGFYYE